MDQPPLLSVVDRIDSALARIEQTLAQSDANMRDLSRRHETLKAVVGEVLGEIDAFLAPDEQ